MKSLKWLALSLAVFMMLAAAAMAAAVGIDVYAAEYPVEKGGSYSSMEEVAVYIYTFGSLPENYITKKEAQRLGWDSSRGNLWQVAPGCSIGGDRFGNYEGQLPDASGRKWTECDIDYSGGYRGSKRIIYSSDGLIYYTGNHYSSFDEITVHKEDAEPAQKQDEILYTAAAPVYGETYTDWENVAAYILQYGELPINYITRNEAAELGFDSKLDNMGEVAPEFAIGGGSFQNREGLLPAASGRAWHECDVDMVNGKRGKSRIVYSNDGLVYLTRDNHKSFMKVEAK